MSFSLNDGCKTPWICCASLPRIGSRLTRLLDFRAIDACCFQMLSVGHTAIRRDNVYAAHAGKDPIYRVLVPLSSPREDVNLMRIELCQYSMIWNVSGQDYATHVLGLRVGKTFNDSFTTDLIMGVETNVTRAYRVINLDVTTRASFNYIETIASWEGNCDNERNMVLTRTNMYESFSDTSCYKELLFVIQYGSEVMDYGESSIFMKFMIRDPYSFISGWIKD
jgi:hypothetical protein